MAEAPSLIYNDRPGAIPATYRFPPGLTARLSSVSARFDGTGASGTFLACLSLYSQDGKLIGRWFPSQTFVAGDTGEVSYGPFLGGDSAAGGGAIPVVASGTFNPAADFVAITSTNSAAPTTIVAASSFVADGLTTYRVDVAIAAVDVSVTNTGTGAAAVIVGLRNATALGGIADFNVNPINGTYGSIPLFASFLDTPPAGAVVYTISGYKGLSGGATANVNAYGNTLTPPPAGGTHAGYVAVYQVSA